MLRSTTITLTAAATTAMLALSAVPAGASVSPQAWKRTPTHYAAEGAHLGPGETEPTTTYYQGRRWSRTVTYVVGDSMAGQVATPVHLARPTWKNKPRTKSGSAFRLVAGGTTEADQYSTAVLRQMVRDRQLGRRVIAVVATQDNSIADWRSTIWRLRVNGIRVRLVTPTPVANRVAHAGDDYTIAHRGIGRWSTLKAAAATNTPVVDTYPLVARPAGGGMYRGAIGGTIVQRSGSHVTNGFADRYLTGPIGRIL